MPAALHRMCRTEEVEPVVITSKFMMTSSRQVSDYLLCFDCEQILNRNGEHWVLPKLATWDRGFPFYNLLTEIPAVVKDGKLLAYASGRNPSIDAGKVIHFAMGIFWKAAVHSWRGGKTEPRLQLGPYTELIRQFVIGDAAFPENVALSLHVLSPPAKAFTFFQPYQGAARGSFRVSAFYVPGMEFTLSVGKRIPIEIMRTAVSTAPDHAILAHDFSGQMHEMYKRLSGKAKKSKKLVQLLANSKLRTPAPTS
ncbi:MAG: hypothetical protein JWO20_2083 [Candidatus Angelobacter sp.]|nr:hypothetical protein [Candidatus Angelobacter sp.]